MRPKLALELGPSIEPLEPVPQRVDILPEAVILRITIAVGSKKYTFPALSTVIAAG
jgi:hypothetical protein